MAAAINTVDQAMLACGLTAADSVTFATEVFMDSFETCRDMSDADLTPLLKEGFDCFQPKK